MENFSFLKNDYRDLYLLCSDVAKYIDSDKSISMLKARQAIEYIVKYLGAETDDLFVNINNLEDKNIANSRLIDLFHLIRKKANKNVHNEINADTEGVLDALIEICVWLAVGHDKKNISVIKFTDKEKYFLKKYGKYEAGNLEEEIDVVDTINPLEVVGKFSDEDIETADVLEQDVFETYEEYCQRIESLPAIKIGYAFLDSSQIDDYCEVAFPLFHVSKNPKIESATVAAFYATDGGKEKSIDGIIKAKLKIYDDKIYYDYGSVTLQDDDNEINIFPISWDKYGYETEEQFATRINNLPLLPVGVAKPIKREYDLKSQILPFETIPLSYVANLFLQKKVPCSLNRDDARELCLSKTIFKVYSKFEDLHNIDKNLQILNQENNTVLIINNGKTIKNSIAKTKFEMYLNMANLGNSDAQFNLARCYEYAYGIEENETEAIKWYKIAAENGYSVAQFKLAECYIKGIGTEIDEQKAFEWCKKAAENDYIEAQFQLAQRYDFGEGTNKDKFKAFGWYKKAAENGHALAQYELACCYEDGIGTEEDAQRSNEWEERAEKTFFSNMLFNSEIIWIMKIAKQGNVKAQYELADFYNFLTFYNESEELEEEAFKWYKKAAENGHAKAQYELASRYEHGMGTEEDEHKALKWYKKAAENGDDEAQNELARIYEIGRGTEKDERKAFEWYTKAAENGNCEAQYKLSCYYKKGIITEKDERKAFEWFTKAAENGNTQVQYELAKRYELGLEVEKDDFKAFEWYKKAAENGNTDAKYELACRYKKGKGTEQNELLAFEWCIKGAKCGDWKAIDQLIEFPDWSIGTEQDKVDAFEVCKLNAEKNLSNYQYKLSTCYAKGIGTKKDELKAREWLEKAAKKGYAKAQYELACSYVKHKRTSEDEKIAFEWFKKSAENGYIDAQLNLAICYEEGKGVAKDERKAFIWYKKVAEQGNVSSQYETAERYELGIGTERDDQKAFEWYLKAAEQGNVEAKQKVIAKLNNVKFSVLVIGKLSSGKSTLVNALLGKGISPTGNVPTTNITSKIIYGKLPTYTLHYWSGRVRHVSEEQFLNLKAYSLLNPNLFIDIKYAKVEYPTEFCQNNIEVVDTPGTFDKSADCPETNYEYLNNADAVVLLWTVNESLPETEDFFIRERWLFNEWKQKCFIVVNKKDELTALEDEKRVKQSFVTALNELGLGDFSERVFVVSSKQALLYRRNESGETLESDLLQMLPATIEETGFPEFEKELNNYISIKRLDVFMDNIKAMDLSIDNLSAEAKRFNNMGVDYLNGKNGMPCNKEMAIYCFKKAIELGSKIAEENLLKATGK